MRLLSSWRRTNRKDSLTGNLVRLTKPVMDDHAEWAELRLASRNFLEPWESEWDDGELTKTSFKARIKRYRELRDQDLAYAYFIRTIDEDRLAGAITLSNVRRGIAQSATLGYWTGKPFARHGYMTEALRLLIPHAFADLRLHRIEAACLPHNTPSISLLTKCGFEREGFAKAYLKIAGRWEDHYLFARVNSAMT